MVDIHSHIIPQFDDGSRSLEESLQLATNQSAAGTRTILATPHVESQLDINNADRIVEKVAMLNEEIGKRKISIRVEPGAELFPGTYVLRALDAGLPITLAGTGRYLLFDMPHGAMMPADFEEVIFSLLTQRVIPILAHPERSPYFNEEIDKVEEYLDRGVVFQVNSGSFVGRHGPKAKQFAELMFQRRFAQFLASDAHRGQSRPLGQVSQMLSTRGNEEYVKLLTVDSGMAVLRGEALPRRPGPASASENDPWWAKITRPFQRQAL